MSQENISDSQERALEDVQEIVKTKEAIELALSLSNSACFYGDLNTREITATLHKLLGGEVYALETKAHEAMTNFKGEE